MRIDYIVTLANEPMRIQFAAMERSLRAAGCNLPIRVIPYDHQLFSLPEKSSWWELPEVTNWLASVNASPRLRKYQALLIPHYQFADPDIVFLDDPARVLEAHRDFVATDTEWNKPQFTVSEQSRVILSERSSTWQRTCFNSGQFACERALYDIERLKSVSGDRRYANTCLHYPVHDQPAMNLMVHLAEIPIVNLTMPPYNMESTWAGDYDCNDYARIWENNPRKPYLIHWAGPVLEYDRPINELFYEFLTVSERAEWGEAQRQRRIRQRAEYRRRLPPMSRVSFELKQAVKGALGLFHINTGARSHSIGLGRHD